MYDSRSKELVSREIIRLTREVFQALRSPVSEAWLVGLGGQGTWVGEWLSGGFMSDHIYLVERDKKRAERIMRCETVKKAKHIRLCQTALRNFPSVFMAERGRKLGIDVLDLDFNGTLESALKDVSAVMPLVARGKGKVLALTVADSRRNQSLNDVAKAAKQIQAFFSEGSEQAMLETAWQRLCVEHASHRATHTFPGGGDPLKAAFRELTTIVQLAKIAKAHGLEIDPNYGQRFIYTGDDAFRMRRFFLRFRAQELATVGAGVLEFLRRTCFYVSQDSATQLTDQLDSTTMFPRFSDIAEERYTFMTTRTAQEQQPTEPAPSIPAVPSVPPVLSQDDRDFVQRGLEFFDDELKKAFEDLFLAAKGNEVPPKQLAASKRRLQLAALNTRFRQIITSLEQRIDFTTHRERFVKESALGSCFDEFRATFTELVQQEADRLCALAVKHDLTMEQLQGLLCEQYDLTIVDGVVMSRGPVETPSSTQLEQRVEQPAMSQNADQRGDRRTMTPSLMQKDKAKEEALGMIIALQGKTGEEREAVAIRVLGDRYKQHPRVLHSILARWSGAPRPASCAVYLACATSEEEMRRRYHRLV